MMRRDTLTLAVALSTIVFSAGCTVEDGTPEENIDHNENAVFANTAELNGSGQNGSGQNGSGQNGSGQNGSGQNGSGQNGSGQNGSLVGASFSISSITGGKIGNLNLNAATTRALVKATILENKPMLPALLGMTVTGKLGSGDTVTLKIESQTTFASLDGDPLHRYKISFSSALSNNAYVCGLHADGTPIETIPLTGWWNYEQGTPKGGSKHEDDNFITFACQGYALYKCVDFGYHPWEPRKNKKSPEPADLHQACTRMIRADYCGDGTPWTVDGTIINLYDHIGIQDDTEAWPIEAEWDENGARCLSHQRIQNLPTTPQCPFELAHDTCGNPASWKSGTLLVSEAQ